MSDRSEPPTKKRRIKAPVKEEPIQCKEEETEDEPELEELSQLLGQIRKVTRRNEDLARVLDETTTETTKLKTQLDYLWVVHYLRAENPMLKPTRILISPRKRPPARSKSPKKRAWQ